MDKQVLNRLKRAQGQLEALIGVAESPAADCADVLVRAKTIRQALDGFARAYVQDHMEQCIRSSNTDKELADKLQTALKYFT